MYDENVDFHFNSNQYVGVTLLTKNIRDNDAEPLLENTPVDAGTCEKDESKRRHLTEK